MSDLLQKYSILFLGDLTPFSRSSQRRDALVALGASVESLSWSSDKSPHFFEKLFSKFRIPLDEMGANQALLYWAKKRQFDLIWIEKGNTIWPGTLRRVRSLLPRAKFLSLSEDDMYALHNRSRYYTKGLGLYDVVFTTKTYNLLELKELGAKRVELFLDAYDEQLHHPVSLTVEEQERYGCDVGFIGTFEQDRANQMLFLAEHGVRVSIWGSGWEAWSGRHENLLAHTKAIYGEEYVKAINATKINLCFLRKINRDEVTSRSVEIPACGGFMLGERTKRHLEFFEEGKEAEFFGSPEELLEKITHYLEHETERNTIAAAGRRRCMTSGYGIRSELEEIFKKL